MKVELHLHTSRYSGCASATAYQLMQALIDARYDAVYITEHDAIWTHWELEALQKEFPSVRILPGMELTISREPLQHLVVLGTNDPTYLELDSIGDILDKARDSGHLTVLAHPCRWPGAAELLGHGLLPDALEYETCNHNPAQACKAKALADKYKLPLVNAGDTHALSFLGRFWIETHEPVLASGDIRELVLGGRYDNRVGKGGTVRVF